KLGLCAGAVADIRRDIALVPNVIATQPRMIFIASSQRTQESLGILLVIIVVQAQPWEPTGGCAATVLRGDGLIFARQQAGMCVAARGPGRACYVHFANDGLPAVGSGQFE